MSFIPAKTLLSEQQRQKWAEGVRTAVKDLSPGVKKQYESQIERFHDFGTSAEGECVTNAFTSLPPLLTVLATPRRVMPFAGFLPVRGLQPKPKARYMSIASALMHPLSRGRAHIVSVDPTAAPAIDPSKCITPPSS